ncbi:MAG: VIT family protein [Microthrixaceae bacterium]
MPPHHGPARRHLESHKSSRTSWLRASVLGANDGILSTGALLLGVTSAGATEQAILFAGIAGLTAGAASMGLGEYVSVSAQRDVELTERAIEAQEIIDDPEGELAELTSIYESRGLTPELAGTVAQQLMEIDPLEAHLRDELGQTELTVAKPVEAAISSFLSFAVGAALPLLVAALAPAGIRGVCIAMATLLGLVALGAVAARLGGANLARGSIRVGVGGAIALGLTFAIGSLLGTSAL